MDLVTSYFFLGLTSVSIGVLLGNANGGIKRHLAYFFCLSVYLFYLFITPFYMYKMGVKSIILSDISDYYDDGLNMSVINLCSFIIGYWIVRGKKLELTSDLNPSLNSAEKSESKNVFKTYIILYGIVLLNISLSGASVLNVFLGKSVLGLGARGFSYYLMNAVDGLITTNIMGVLFNVKRRIFLIMLFSSFFLFILLGFRYRILLSLIGIGIVWLYKIQFNVRTIILPTVFAVFSFYLILFSTFNRKNLFEKNWLNLTYNPSLFDYSIIFEQTRGALADMAIIRGFEIKNLEHDYGVTTFFYPFIRLMPRFILTNKDGYYPSPQLSTTIKAYDIPYSATVGEATTNVGAFYIHGGIYGVILGSFLMGVLIKTFNNRINVKSNWSLLLNITFSVSLFQWITRGYFPQWIDTFVYMAIPVYVFRELSKKTLTKRLFKKKTPKTA
ncbi:O-antigen polymerase [Haliscomenobacter sp.]|uniref:O-antigen polymerase n=1 Tax=Haliscomenobacter sp. TaxID=2717303 RepID=UPI00359408D9